MLKINIYQFGGERGGRLRAMNGNERIYAGTVAVLIQHFFPAIDRNLGGAHSWCPAADHSGMATPMLLRMSTDTAEERMLKLNVSKKLLQNYPRQRGE
jgi:hypothetical protein